MSWNGTVRCGYCYGKGHNKRGCPKIAAEIEKNPNGHQAQIRQAKKARARPRVCGYCHESGHNKRTCQKITTDRHSTKTANRIWRKKFFEIAEDCGFDHGTLVELIDPETIEDRWERDDAERQQEKFGKLGIVVRCGKERLNYNRQNPDYRGSYFDASLVCVLFPNGRKGEIELPEEFNELVNRRRIPKWKIACGVRSELKKRYDQEFHSGQFSVDHMLGL